MSFFSKTEEFLYFFERAYCCGKSEWAKRTTMPSFDHSELAARCENGPPLSRVRRRGKERKGVVGWTGYNNKRVFLLLVGKGKVCGCAPFDFLFRLSSCVKDRAGKKTGFLAFVDTLSSLIAKWDF